VRLCLFFIVFFSNVFAWYLSAIRGVYIFSIPPGVDTISPAMGFAFGVMGLFLCYITFTSTSQCLNKFLCKITGSKSLFSLLISWRILGPKFNTHHLPIAFYLPWNWPWKVHTTLKRDLNSLIRQFQNVWPEFALQRNWYWHYMHVIMSRAAETFYRS
jgi:hypothetical protein